MANNPFDPPIVQVKKVLDRGGISTVNRGYGSRKTGTTRTRSAPPSGAALSVESMDDLTDVDLTGLVDGQVIVWNTATGEWVPATLDGGAVILDDLTDVDLTGLTDGQILVWDATAGQWIPVTPGAGGATTLDALTDVDTSTVPPTSGQALVWDGTQWEPGTVSGGGGGGATTLDGLTDVDTAGFGDGYVLTYDATTSQWIPTPGGGAVGSWENDQLVTFTTGTLTETTESFTASGITFPGSPQSTVTVTSEMLATADKAVGFSHLLTIVFLFDASAMTGATSGILVGEMTYGGDIVTQNTSISTTSNAKAAVTFSFRDPVVGDVLTFRFRLANAAHGGVNCINRGILGLPTSLFKDYPAGGGRWLYTDFITGTQIAAPFQVSKGASSSLGNWKYYEKDVLLTATSASSPENYQTKWIPGSTLGLIMSSNLHLSGSRLQSGSAATSTASPYTIFWLRSPATMRYDRLAIPTPP